MKDYLITLIKGLGFKGWLYLLWAPLFLTGSYLLRDTTGSPYGSMYLVCILTFFLLFFVQPVKGEIGMPTRFKVPLIIALQSLIITGGIAYWDPVNRNLGTPTEDTLTRVVTDTVTYRASCDSITQVINQNEIVDNRTITRKWDFTTDTLVSTTKVTKSSDTIWSYKPLTIDSLRCGDTVTVAKKGIPYEDRNVRLTRIIREYIQEGSWTVKEDTIYRNQSPSILNRELNKIFSGKKARWTHTVNNTKYTLSLLHDNKTDTLDSKDDAQGLLEAKCKDAATKKKEFSYAEFNACKSNGTIAKVRIPQEKFCGTTKVFLSYNRGSLSRQPNSCWGTDPSWRYEGTTSWRYKGTTSWKIVE